MKYPLQKELESDLIESMKLLYELNAVLHSDRERYVAQRYVDAIQRIITICENRKRY